MSYPEPIEGESPERLYKQAIFFYNQYENTKRELAIAIETIGRMKSDIDYYNDWIMNETIPKPSFRSDYDSPWGDKPSVDGRTLTNLTVSLISKDQVIDPNCVITTIGRIEVLEGKPLCKHCNKEIVSRGTYYIHKDTMIERCELFAELK